MSKQYHIGLSKGEVASNVLLCGDYNRAEKTAKLFDRIKLTRHNREFLAYTGIYKGLPVTAMATGIGPANTEIALIELSQIAKDLTIIRVGSCGGLQKYISVGDQIISTAALRLENTSLFFVPEGYPAVAHYDVILALKKSADNIKQKGGGKYHIGLTATAPGFYGAQGRVIKGFPILTPDITKYFSKIGVLNFEMETSTLLTLAQLKNYRAGSICTVFIDRCRYKIIDPELKKKAELNCIKTALNGLEILNK
ncbi:MAG: nucleoside phosphorylase [Planctomycetota bacterium]|nr:nucleoside phosphorylase [Planctomycetota bacterium]MDI6786786.1 nucleoside phosphorylase [Planctomycetota bacterium]